MQKLEWQHNANGLNEGGEAIGKGTLITRVNVIEESFGTMIGRIKAEETRKVFWRGMNLLSIGKVGESSDREIIWIRIDALWLKRIWRASEFR